MKRTIILLSFLCLAFAAGAQNRPGGGGSSIVGHISGTVIDSLTKQPVPYASVSIFTNGSTSPFSGAMTDDKGNFKIDNIHPGKYKISVSFIGYHTVNIDQVVTTDAKPDKNMGSILVTSGKTTALKEVSVVGQAPLVQNKIDRIVYNVEKDVTASGGTALDVLGKVPLVAVDMNGNVSVRGDQNIQIFINGKPTGASSASLSDVMRAIPADQIKNIEVITSPSAKYDAEGSGGIINIVTKKQNVSGFSGSINGGVGTRQNNGNLNLNFNHDRFHLSANIGGFLSWPQTSTSEFEQHIQNDSINTTTSSTGTSRVSRHAVNSSISAGYDFNAFNSINSTFRLMHFQFNTDGSSNTISASPYSSQSSGINSFSNFDWNLDYTHKFNKDGHELDFLTEWSRGSGVTDYTNQYSAVFPNVKNNIDGINNEYTLQLDYTLPISKVLKFEAGGKSILRRINSTSDYYDFNAGGFVYDPTNSNVYNYNQNVYAGYSVFTITLPKQWSILAGLRDEVTDIQGNPFNASQNLSPFSQNYNTLAPSLTLQKQLNKTNTIKLVYSKRISRPNLRYLNPFVNQSSIQNQSVGNPQLDPEISQTYEFDYSSFLGSSNINASVYYRHTSNAIEGIAEPISVTVNQIAEGGTLTTYQNVGNNNSWGGSLFGSIQPFKILTIMGNINAFTYNPDPSGRYSSQQSQTGTYLQYGGFLRGTLTLPHNLLAEMFAFGNSPRHTIQGTNPAFSMYGIGVRKQFMQKKMSVGINVLQPFSADKHFDSSISSPGFTQTSKNTIPFRSFGVTFSYSFGKMSFKDNQQRKGGSDMNQGGEQGQGAGLPGAGS